MKIKVNRVTLVVLAAALEDMALEGIGCYIQKGMIWNHLFNLCLSFRPDVQSLQVILGRPRWACVGRNLTAALNMFECSFPSHRLGIYSFIFANPKIT